MNIVLGAAGCALFCSLLIKSKNRELSLLLSISGVVLILLNVAGDVKSIVSKISGFSNLYSGSGEYIKLMLKVLSITLITQLVGDLCRDNGENALAGATEFGAKIIVVSMVLPLFEMIITIVGGFLK